MMDYPCGKFGDCSFSRFGSIVRTNTHTQTDADEHFTPATVICVSNYLMHGILLLQNLISDNLGC